MGVVYYDHSEHRTPNAEWNSFVTCLRLLRQSEYWAPNLSGGKTQLKQGLLQPDLLIQGLIYEEKLAQASWHEICMIQ
jgi:hypothetical protein